MSVIQCNRNGCEKFEGVNRHSPDHGYVCDECFEELVGGTTLGADVFMRTDKKVREIHKETWAKLYDTIFPKVGGEDE